jgi:tetratricopeptide (TPR) repeat protein
MTEPVQYEKVCFVIMPFNKKKVGKKMVDFDFIYHEIFEPSIKKAVLPEGGALEPKRTDVDKFVSSISQDMFEYIVYSRIAFTDISGFNPNVFYELGIRHGTQESGTVLFRQPGIAIPFDINSIKVFDYEFDTKKNIADSRALITEVLTNSLQRNRLDSPVRIALRAQRPSIASSEVPSTSRKVETAQAASPSTSTELESIETAVEGDRQQSLIDAIMQEAEEAHRIEDLSSARALYKVALRVNPNNIIARMRLGLTLKRMARHFDALAQFSYITQYASNYAEAWREKGVIESLINRLVPESKRPDWLPSGEDSLRQATILNPQDFDAWASWGGVLRRKSDFPGAYEKYQQAVVASDGHPYPLLNAIKLEAKTTGKIKLSGRKKQLCSAEKLRQSQTQADPPVDVPWCYYDLAEMKLYQQDREGFLNYLSEGLKHSDQEWQIETFYNALKETLVENKIDLPGLKAGMKKLQQAMSQFKKK